MVAEAVPAAEDLVAGNASVLLRRARVGPVADVDLVPADHRGRADRVGDPDLAVAVVAGGEPSVGRIEPQARALLGNVARVRVARNGDVAAGDGGVARS